MKHRGSLNLELSLLITLLVLVCVVSLSWMGSGIANQYAFATGALGVAGGVSGPSDGTATDNGDGSWNIGWTGGQPPFQVVRSPQPDLSNRVPIGAPTSNRSYTVLPSDLLPGDNYIGVVDGGGKTLPTPIHIIAPLPKPALPLVCPEPTMTTAVAARVEVPPTDGSGPRNPLVWISLADYAAPPVGWPDTQIDPATGTTLSNDSLCLRCHPVGLP